VAGDANTNGQEAQQNQDTQTVRIKYARDTGTVANRNAARGIAVTGVLSTNGANNRLNLDSRFADTATTGAITNAVAGETLTVGLNNFSGETLTATGAFTVRVSVVETATSTTTFTIAGGAGLSGVTASTFTLTTQSFGYGTSYSFGSAAAMAAAGNGIKLSAAGGLDLLELQDQELFFHQLPVRELHQVVMNSAR